MAVASPIGTQFEPVNERYCLDPASVAPLVSILAANGFSAKAIAAPANASFEADGSIAPTMGSMAPVVPWLAILQVGTTPAQMQNQGPNPNQIVYANAGVLASLFIDGYPEDVATEMLRKAVSGQFGGK